jgi:Tfp pilus assembly protein PilF
LLAPLTTFFAKLRLRSALRNEKYLKVLEHGEAILAQNPWDTTTQLCMAEAAAALDQIVMAVWILEQAREKNAQDPRVNRALAALCEKLGRFPEAMHLWELVRKALPSDLEAQNKAKSLAVSETIARGNYEEVMAGESAFKPPSDRPTGATPAPPTRGKTPAQERVAREEAALRSRLENDPSNADCYLQLANWKHRHGQLRDAKAVLEQGLERAGQKAELSLALTNLEIEPYRRALAKVEEDLRAQPEDAKQQHTREKLIKEINKREIELYRQKIAHDSTDKVNHFELGVRMMQAGQVEEAIREFQTARAEPKLHWQALLNLGRCFTLRQNWALARRNFEEALQHIPEGEEARKDLLFDLAQGYAATGELARAVELGMDLANLDYGYRNIGHLLDEWQTRLQQAAS